VGRKTGEAKPCSGDPVFRERGNGKKMRQSRQKPQNDRMGKKELIKMEDEILFYKTGNKDLSRFH
jgi:hypothetical protein